VAHALQTSIPENVAASLFESLPWPAATFAVNIQQVCVVILALCAPAIWQLDQTQVLFLGTVYVYSNCRWIWSAKVTPIHKIPNKRREDISKNSLHYPPPTQQAEKKYKKVNHKKK
jgi:hypothetical protein